MEINKERLWARLLELGQIGKQTSGGVTRYSFTLNESRAKDLVITYMKEAGLAVREDAAREHPGSSPVHSSSPLCCPE